MIGRGGQKRPELRWNPVVQCFCNSRRASGGLRRRTEKHSATDDQAQAIIREFLEKKDPERTAVLKRSIAHGGQQQPAIITCDGFLINGNRRKMVMDWLQKENPNEEIFQYMKAVILPRRYRSRPRICARRCFPAVHRQRRRR